MRLGLVRLDTGAHVGAEGRWHAAGGSLVDRHSMGPGSVMADVHVHVGLPKTGTTSIQAALDAHTAALAEAGVLYPGGRHRAHRLAAYDLLGQRVRGDDADLVAGAFNRLVEQMAAHPGRSVVSEEELGLARPRHVRKLARGLVPHRVHVVIGVRDMARTVVSAWQQDVVTGGTTSWRDFIAAVREPRQQVVPAATAFWIRHDPLRVIDAWSTSVPVERISVVTVPPSGASSRTLLERFAVAAALPIELLGVGEPRPRNVSFGAAELEVIRRLNPTALGRLNQEQYRFVIEQGIRSRLAGDRSRQLRLPPEHLAWARQYGEGLAGELRRRGVRVIGDLADLVRSGCPRRPRRSTWCPKPSCGTPRRRLWRPSHSHTELSSGDFAVASSSERAGFPRLRRCSAAASARPGSTSRRPPCGVPATAVSSPGPRERTSNAPPGDGSECAPRCVSGVD